MVRDPAHENIGRIISLEAERSGKIERRAIVFVLGEQRQVLGRKQSDSGERVEPGGGVAIRLPLELRFSRKHPQAHTGIRLERLSWIADDRVNALGQYSQVKTRLSAEGNGDAETGSCDGLLLDVGCRIVELRFDSQPIDSGEEIPNLPAVGD